MVLMVLMTARTGRAFAGVLAAMALAGGACTTTPPAVPQPAATVPEHVADTAPATGSAALGQVAAFPPAPPLPVDDVWAELAARPLRLPPLAAGLPCPQTEGAVVSPVFGAPSLGAGPVYAGWAGATNAVPFRGGPFVRTRLPAAHAGAPAVDVPLIKVVWLIAPDHPGPVLIRGRQLDGPHEVRFWERYAAELRIGATNGLRDGAGGWRDWPSYTIVPAPGCYAYQIDGHGLSTHIVFAVIA